MGNKKTNLIVILMLLALFLLRGTRAPNSVPMSVLLWVMSFFVVAFTLAEYRFSRMRWTRLAALLVTVGMLLIPPVPDAWLSGLPDVVPATAVLVFLSALMSKERKDIPLHGATHEGGDSGDIECALDIPSPVIPHLRKNIDGFIIRIPMSGYVCRDGRDSVPPVRRCPARRSMAGIRSGGSRL